MQDHVVVVEDGGPVNEDFEKSLDLEASAFDERDPLVASSHNSRKGRRLLRKSSCIRDFRRPAWLTVGVCKIGFLVLVMSACLGLFLLNSEAEEGAFLHAVSVGSPWVQNLGPRAAGVEATLWVQRLAFPLEVGTQVLLRVVSGERCPENGTCTLLLSSMPGIRASIADSFKLDQDQNSSVIVTTNSTIPVAIMVKLLELNDVASASVIIAGVVLVCVYAMIILEIVHRTLAAMLGAFAALAVLSSIHERPSFEEIMTWVDWETCGLLFGMMIMVGIFSTTGFFEYCAVRMYKLSRGRLWRLVALLCLFTAFLSAFLDNVTTILLVVPVTMQLCHVLDVDPVLPVMSLVFFSNIGGTATAIGDPPNILLVSDSRLQLHSKGQINFGQMTVHLLPGAVMAGAAAFLLVRRWFRAAPDGGGAAAARQHELGIWRRTAARVVGASPEELRVRQELKKKLRHVAALEKQLQEEEAAAKSEEGSFRVVDISELEKKYMIRDWPLFVSSSVLLGGVVVLFFLHSFVDIHLNLAWIACIGAMLHMVISGVKDIEQVIEHVEWSTLMFFAALFILMRALDRLGLIQYFGLQVAYWISQVPESGQLAAAVTIVVWISGIGSAFVDNIPITGALIPVVVQLSSAPLNLPVGPLVWALAFGACLGGNGTLVGASANVVAAGLLESAGHPLTFNRFFAKGAPIALISLAVANVYLLVFHVAIPWY